MTRVKKVFSSTAEVCPVFAQRTYTEGHAGNVYFYGDKIYSYGSHYLLAEFIGNNAIVINDRGYSSSTGTHISTVRSATRQYKQFFYTKTDLNYILRTTKDNLDKLVKAKKPELYIAPIFSMWESLNEFISFKKATKDYNKKPEYKELKKLVKSLEKDKDGLLNKIKIRQEKEKAAKLAKFKEDIEKFEAYELNYINFDWIRISQDGLTIQSSQGVSVDIEEAKLLYKLIEANRDIIGHKIGGYTVISKNGTLQIGCHHIDMDAVHKVGKIITQ